MALKYSKGLRKKIEKEMDNIAAQAWNSATRAILESHSYSYSYPETEAEPHSYSHSDCISESHSYYDERILMAKKSINKANKALKKIMDELDRLVK